MNRPMAVSGVRSSCDDAGQEIALGAGQRFAPAHEDRSQDVPGDGGATEGQHQHAGRRCGWTRSAHRQGHDAHRQQQDGGDQHRQDQDQLRPAQLDAGGRRCASPDYATRSGRAGSSVELVAAAGPPGCRADPRPGPPRPAAAGRSRSGRSPTSACPGGPGRACGGGCCASPRRRSAAPARSCCASHPGSRTGGCRTRATGS